MSKLLLPSPDPKWAPEYWTKPQSAYTRGQDFIDFSEAFLTASRGFKQGQPLEMTSQQQWLTNAIFEEDTDGYLLKRTGLVGLPRKNGKSLLGSDFCLEVLATGDRGLQIYSAAKNRDQAKIVFNEAKEQVARNPFLSNLIKPYKDALENKQTGSFYKALSADAKSAQGLGPYLVVADELHIWEAENGSERARDFWAALTAGSADRPESLVLAITTAGAYKDSILGRLYDYGIKVATGEIDDPYFGFWWWEAPDDLPIDDPETWMKANPNYAEGLLSEKFFRAELKKAEATGYDSFRRYHLNQWRTLAGEAFMNPVHWRNAVKDLPIKPGAKVTAGFDGSQSGDTTAIYITDVETEVTQEWRSWENTTNDPAWFVEKDEIIKSLYELIETFDLEMLWADPNYFQNDLIKLSRTKEFKGRIQQIPQHPSRITPIAQAFVGDIINGHAFHRNEPKFTQDVFNAMLREDGGWTKDVKNSKHRIDRLVAAGLSNGAKNNYKLKLQKSTKILIIK